MTEPTTKSYAMQYMENEGFSPRVQELPGQYIIRCYAIDPKNPPSKHIQPDETLPVQCIKTTLKYTDEAGYGDTVPDDAKRRIEKLALSQIRARRAVGFFDGYHGHLNFAARFMQELKRGGDGVFDRQLSEQERKLVEHLEAGSDQPE